MRRCWQTPVPRDQMPRDALEKLLELVSSSTIIDHQSRNHALSFSLRFNLFQTSLLHFYFPSELPLHSLQLTA